MSINFEEIVFRSPGDRDRFLAWIQEKIKSSDVVEIMEEELGLTSTKKNKTFVFRFFRAINDKQVWVLTPFDAPAPASFYPYNKGEVL